mgnify:FL=1
MHKKTQVWRAGEAGEQARASGSGPGGGMNCKNGPLSAYLPDSNAGR